MGSNCCTSRAQEVDNHYSDQPNSHIMYRVNRRVKQRSARDNRNKSTVVHSMSNLDAKRNNGLTSEAVQ